MKNEAVKCFVCSQPVGSDGVLADGKYELNNLCADCNGPRIYDDAFDAEEQTMTHTDIELRALDIEVAEKVFDWKWRRRSENPNEPAFLTPDEYAGYAPLWMLAEDDWPHGGVDNWLLPRFTTDPSAFMALWDTLEDQAGVGVTVIGGKRAPSEARVGMVFPSSGKRVKRCSQAYGPTRLIALALAAIAACESKTDGEPL